MAPHWIELTIQAQGSIQDTIGTYLVEHGSTGVISRARSLCAFFPGTTDVATLRPLIRQYLRRLRQIFPDSIVGRARWRTIAERNWHEAWRDYFKPQRIGRSFLIIPPWIEPGETGRHVVFIEPAMAFGTGTHETTRGCLEFIDELCCDSPPAKALDVGTGSGILAIGLARLGVRKVLALDKDPVALEAAKGNLQLNKMHEAVTLSSRGVAGIRRRFPLVVSNIILETLVELAGPLARCVGGQGALILSGLLHDHVPVALGSFKKFRLEGHKQRKEWSTLLLRRES